ncbi:outer membrane protein [Bradyrhizobium sp. CCGUVB23]|uniref:outer membrane protein n=1 Tax=Bradyrhizobium sp. CCGUVB23 TaxID=2949630 RepID=UPI0020B26A07|nr:outer membrane beta-barrel protein [Bradyrhizobium sp. CCGUVB23]MCP3463854.1 outer membrane beta-barrel protein [Bradyrhizobium sp. CCGUVB23]
MRTTLAAAAALFATTVAGSAADLAPVYTKAPAAVYSWTGFYIGGNLGGGMASSHFDDPDFYAASVTPARGFFTGGAQIGYNYQFGRGLVGIEADVNGNSDFKGTVLGGDWSRAMTVTTKADVSGTIRARAGLVIDNALVYATGGAAWADVKQTGIEFNNVAASPTFGAPTGLTANRSGVLWGGVIGAGVEYALSPNWIVGGEFLHTVYQDRGANIVTAAGASGCAATRPTANCVIRDQLTTDVARVRLSYKFGDPVPVSTDAYAGAGPRYAKAPAMASVYSWTGFYIGGNAGGGMASSRFDDPCYYCSSTMPTGGFFTGGGQIGYNYQFGSGLVGIEADVNGNSDFKSYVIGGAWTRAMSVASKADVSGTIRARSGVVIDNALVYVTGGAAWANVDQTGTEFNNVTTSSTFGAPTGITANRSGTLWGGVIGAGVEFAVGSNWIVGAEYLHTVYEDRDANIILANGTSACGSSLAANCVVRNQLTTDVARARVSYKFGDQAPVSVKAAPVAALYNWTGLYIGGNAGGGMARSHFDDPCNYCSTATPTSGFFTGGAQIGFNYQFGRGLVGIEADVNGNSRFKESVIGGDDTFAMTVGAKADVSGTIRARAGVVVNNALAYVTGGAAWADVKQTGTEFCNSTGGCGGGLGSGALTGVTANRSGVLWGGVIGAGVEYALNPNWIVGGEFLHTMYQDRDANLVLANGGNVCTPYPASNCVVHNHLTTDVARLRVSYKFGQ